MSEHDDAQINDDIRVLQRVDLISADVRAHLAPNMEADEDQDAFNARCRDEGYIAPDQGDFLPAPDLMRGFCSQPSTDHLTEVVGHVSDVGDIHMVHRDGIRDYLHMGEGVLKVTRDITDMNLLQSSAVPPSRIKALRQTPDYLFGDAGNYENAKNAVDIDSILPQMQVTMRSQLNAARIDALAYATAMGEPGEGRPDLLMELRHGPDKVRMHFSGVDMAPTVTASDYHVKKPRKERKATGPLSSIAKFLSKKSVRLAVGVSALAMMAFASFGGAEKSSAYLVDQDTGHMDKVEISEAHVEIERDISSPISFAAMVALSGQKTGSLQEIAEAATENCVKIQAAHIARGLSDVEKLMALQCQVAKDAVAQITMRVNNDDEQVVIRHDGQSMTAEQTQGPEMEAAAPAAKM